MVLKGCYASAIISWCAHMLIHSIIWLLRMICHVCNAKWPLLMDRRHIRCTCLALHHNYHGICTQWHLYKITLEHNYISYTSTFIYTQKHKYIFNSTNTTEGICLCHILFHNICIQRCVIHDHHMFGRFVWKIHQSWKILYKAPILWYVSSKQRNISCHNTHGYNFPHNSQQFLLHISCDMRPSSRSD